MPQSLEGKTIAFLATDGVEQVELTKPWQAIQQAGAKTVLISTKEGEIQGLNHIDKGDSFPVDATAGSADAQEFDGLVIPGGVVNPDQMRADKDAVAFVRAFFEQKKPVAAICHGPVMLVEADLVRNRKLTSYPNIRTDIKNAGGEWVDEEVVVDEGLVTSRTPDDLEAFCAKTIEEFAEGKHAQQAA